MRASQTSNFQYLTQNLDIPLAIDDLYTVLNTTGPRKLTEVFFAISSQAQYSDARNIGLPSQFLTPLPNSHRDPHGDRNKFLRSLASYITPESVAVHLWDMSWLDTENRGFLGATKKFMKNVGMRGFIKDPWGVSVRIMRWFGRQWKRWVS